MYIASKLHGIQELQAKLNATPRVVEKAIASALNKLGKQGVTATKKSITEIYTINAGDVGKAITHVPAKAAYSGKKSRLFTVLNVKGGRLGIHKFGGLPKLPASQKNIPIAKRKAPTVKILKAEARRKVYPDQYSGNAAFVARMTRGFGGSETNHVGIFVRTTKWLPGAWRPGKGPGEKGSHQVIREPKAKGIAEIFLARGRKEIDHLVRTKGPAILEQDMKYFMSKLPGIALPRPKD